MKFSVKSNDLISAVNKVIGVIPTRSTLPILGNVYFGLAENELTIVGSDLEVYIKVVINVTGKQDGQLAVPAKKLETLLQNLQDKDLTLELLQNFKLSIKTKGGRWSITGEDPNDFPLSGEIENPQSIQINSGLLGKYLAKASHAASHDELRRSMNGVFFEIKSGEFKVVSTDGHRLVKITKTNFDYDGDRLTMLVPVKTCQMITRLFKGIAKTFDVKTEEENKELTDVSADSDSGSLVIIYFSSDFLQCTYNNVTITSRLIDDTFPNYESVIPTDNEKKLKVERIPLISSVKRSIIMSDQVTNRTSFNVSGGELKVKSANNEFGTDSEETVECSYTEDEEFEIAFNGKYLLDAMMQFDSSEIMFDFSSPLKATILRPLEQAEDEDMMMLVMPVRNI